MRSYVDADILIWHLRGDPKALRFLQQLAASPEADLWIGAMQRAEIVFFMRAGEERDTMALLSQLRTAPVDDAIVDRAAGLFRQWKPSHGLDINDAILAATAQVTGGRIYCQNIKHYPMPGLVVERGWA
jgi:hypothetical protein